MNDNPALLVEKNDAVVTLINNDPPRNRMSLEFMDRLEEEIDAIAHDTSVRAARRASQACSIVPSTLPLRLVSGFRTRT